jgi:hypothetical protein
MSESSKYISDKQELFGYLETQDPRHEPRSAGGVSDKPRLSEMSSLFFLISY